MVDYPYKSAKDAPRGTPTPTQEELNEINLGRAPTLSDDGSGPDPFEAMNEETRKRAGVQTRQAQATHTTQPRTTAKPS